MNRLDIVFTYESMILKILSLMITLRKKETATDVGPHANWGEGWEKVLGCPISVYLSIQSPECLLFTLG